MIPHLKLIAYGVVVAVLLGFGIYAKVIYNKAQRVPYLEQAIDNLTAQIDNERTQTAQALERENGIQKKLAAAHAGNADLVRRLRRAYTDGLPKAPSLTPEPERTAGVGSGDDEAELDLAVTGIISACRADSVRLQEWQRYYESVDPTLR